MIKKIFFIIMCAIITACADTRTVPEKIMDSVIVVNSSSGIIVYSGFDTALILTANHVVRDDIDKAKCSGCNYDTEVWLTHYLRAGGEIIREAEDFEVLNIESYAKNDLAIIEVRTDRFLDTTMLARETPLLGEDIWLGANPNLNYRSLKKGIVSSTERFFDSRQITEVSGGIIFGSSGGGAFNRNGELFGIIHSVNRWRSPYCYQVWDSGGNLYSINRISVPLPDIGFVTNTDDLKSFVLKGSYKDYFYYLR